jgi:hypothetical protein
MMWPGRVRVNFTRRLLVVPGRHIVSGLLSVVAVETTATVLAEAQLLVVVESLHRFVPAQREAASTDSSIARQLPWPLPARHCRQGRAAEAGSEQGDRADAALRVELGSVG